MATGAPATAAASLPRDPRGHHHITEEELEDDPNELVALTAAGAPPVSSTEGGVGAGAGAGASSFGIGGETEEARARARAYAYAGGEGIGLVWLALLGVVGVVVVLAIVASNAANGGNGGGASVAPIPSGNANQATLAPSSAVVSPPTLAPESRAPTTKTTVKGPTPALRGPTGTPVVAPDVETPTLQPSPATTRKEWPADFTARFDGAMQLAKGTLSALESYYGDFADRVVFGEGGGLTFAFHADKSAGGAGTGRRPVDAANFQRVSDVMVRHILYQAKLKLGFMGSSVMCGHDNCYRDSLQMQFERSFGDIFKAAGIPVELMNACQGGGCGDSYQNQIFCTKTLVGSRPSLLLYEWTYFENDDDVPEWHEVFERWALLLDSAPPVIMLNAVNTPWGYPLPESALKALKRVYGKFGINGLALANALAKTGKSPGEDAWGKVGDGMHDSTRYGGDGVLWRNWHPGPLGHQLFADLLGVLMVEALADAISRLRAFPTREAAMAAFPHTAPKLERPSELAVTKSPFLVRLAKMETMPKCLTMEKSAFGEPGISIADDAADEANPYRDRVKKLGEEQAWRTWTAGPNLGMVPEKLRDVPECAAPDSCGSFTEPPPSPGPGAATHAPPLVFRIPKPVELGLVMLCGGYDGAETLLRLAKENAFTVELDKSRVDPNTFKALPGSRKCVIVRDGPPIPADASKSGAVYLAVLVKRPNVALGLSQVIAA